MLATIKVASKRTCFSATEVVVNIADRRNTMGICFKFDITAVTEAGDKKLRINSIKETLTGKIIFSVTPFDENGTQYEDFDIWLNNNAKKREISLWEALGKPDDLISCKGMYVGAFVTPNQGKDRMFYNIDKFYPVSQDVFLEVDTDDTPF